MNSLENFVCGVRSAWGPLCTEVVAACRKELERLVRTSAGEEWLTVLLRDAAACHELHRDPQYGFILLSHTEPEGLYRPPHDHGRGWVIYALAQGEIAMNTYARAEDPKGAVKLVERDATLMRPGEVRVYLPGDIHDTRCTDGPALLFRFTERDLKKEDREHKRVTKYVERDGAWVPQVH